ncbi:MAG: CHRD domain-containing protein [Bacteroidota bacterium]|nr:CHRD domain-containing protein [Chitinophagaceae bacterium]MDZ4807555.1 CHRD domain-containing protein [Bacteroidota bacterium]
MKLIKLTVLTSLLFVLVFSMTSCEKNAEKRTTTDYEKTGIILSGAQETPAVPSPALGTMDVRYSKETRTLTYKVTWSGLTDSVSLIHIHGLAPSGFAAGIVQNIVHTSNSIFPQRTNGRFTFLRSGTISGTLLADGVAVKEQDILNGVYYMNIHTPAYPGGEIRGQINFIQ